VATDLELIQYVSAAINKYCATSFSSIVTATADVEGGSEYLALPQGPITGIVSITDRESSVVKTTTAYDYYDNASMIYLIDGTEWSRGRKEAWRVVYTYGYSAAPDDIELATLQWVSDLKGRPNPGIKSERLGDYSVVFLDQIMPRSVRQLLAPYKNARRF
jgi:hypothetical protein